MGRSCWWKQLRFRMLAGFAFVLLVNMFYIEYAMRRTLNTELPQVELQSLMLNGVRLQTELERSYAESGLLSARLLSAPPQNPLRVYNADGTILESSSPVPSTRTAAYVERALRNRVQTAAITGEGSDRYGFQVLPIRHNDRVVGAVEVAAVLPPIDQFQQRIQREFATTATISICSLLAFCLYLGARMNQSLHEIKRQTRAIVHGDFDRRIAVRSNDEIGQVARCINEMAEDLERLAKTRNEFLSKVSHELRTPLTIAKGFTSLLCHGPLLSQQERTVQVIDNQIDDLTRLVNDLLDLSRRQNSTMTLSTQVIDCTEFLAEVQEQHPRMLEEQQITLTVECAASGVQINADRQRLHQVIGNLIGNASRYCRGNIWLNFSADAQHAIIAVRDNGPGIAPEDQARIFEPFFQSKRGKVGRAGLGLTVARELVMAHGGTIEVQSEPGVGTAFMIRLPRTQESRHALPGAGSLKRGSTTYAMEPERALALAAQPTSKAGRQQ